MIQKQTTASCPRRVLITADAVGGVWSYALELGRELSRHGITIVLAGMGPPPSKDKSAEVGAIEGMELRWNPCRLEWMDGGLHDLDRASDWLQQLSADERVELVHLNQYAFGALDWDVPCLVVGHSCVKTWHRAVLNSPTGDKWTQYSIIVERGLMGADAVTAPSEAMLRALHDNYGDFNSIEAIPNGCSTEVTPSKGAVQTANKEPFALTVGRLWDQAKNAASIDEVANSVPWPVIAIGPLCSPDYSTYRPLHMQALGELNRLSVLEWMQRAAIFVSTAKYEPFGLAVLEAAKHRCALVLSDIDTFRELWSGSALFVPVNDSEALERALLRLMCSEQERLEWGTRAAERAMLYSAEQMGQGYRKLYGSLFEARTTVSKINGNAVEQRWEVNR